jgi:putative transposase
LTGHRVWLLALIEAEPDLTLLAVAERLLGEHGIKADAGMLSRFFTGNGISFKKKAFTPRSNFALMSRNGASYGGPCSQRSAPAA